MYDPNALFKQITAYASPVPNVPGLCREQSLEYVRSIKAGVSWAAKMWDSKAKTQPGMFTGNLNSLGNYDGCINVTDVQSAAGNFSGKYCLATISIANTTAWGVVGNLFKEVTQDEDEINLGLGSLLSKGFRWGYCIPSSCTASDLNDDLSDYLRPSGVVVSVSDDDCSIKEEKPFSVPDWIFLVMFLFLMLATFLSTGYDYTKELLKSKNYWQEKRESAQGPSERQSSPNPNPEASPTSSDNPNPDPEPLPGSSRKPNPEAQTARAEMLDLPGSSTEPETRTPEQDVEAGQRELEHSLNYLPRALESPVRDPDPSETDVLTSFSLLSNARSIFSFNDSKLLLTSIDGLKFISLCWIVLAHGCLVAETLPAVNYISIFKYWSNWPSVLFLNTQFPVDTFLLCTGILISYNFFNDMTRRGIKQIASGRVPGGHTVNKLIYIPVFYFHRYIRLAPALAIMILLQASILHHLGSGPFWESGNGYLSRVCQKTWWGSLLFVQNYINGEELCLAHSWYTMVDYQLYLIAPVILFAFLYIKGLKAMLVPAVFILIGISSTSFVNLYFKLPATMMKGGAEKWHLKIKYEYVTAYTRLAPWMIGMIVGVFLHDCRFEERKNPYSFIPLKLLIIGWLVSLASLSYSVFGIIPFARERCNDSVVLHAMYTSISQILWAIGIAWIVIVCETGHGGILHAALSQKLFQPLQRLSYCTYLVHLPLMMHRALLTRVPIHVNKTSGVASFFGDLLLSLLFAVALCLLVELPFRRIFKTISINYGFSLRFTEDRYVTRRASEYDRMWEALRQVYSKFYGRRHGYKRTEPVAYSAVQRGDETDEPAVQQGAGEEAVQQGAGTLAVQQGADKAAVQQGAGEAAVQQGAGTLAVQQGAGTLAVQQGAGAPAVQQGAGEAAVQQGAGTLAVQQGADKAAVQQGAGKAAVQQGAGEAAVQQGAGTLAVQQGAGEAAVQQGAGEAAVQQGAGTLAVQQGAGEAAVQQGAGEAAVQQGAGEAAVQQGAGEAAVQQGAGEAAVQQGAGAQAVQQGAGTPAVQQGAGALTVQQGAE